MIAHHLIIHPLLTLPKVPRKVAQAKLLKAVNPNVSVLMYQLPPTAVLVKILNRLTNTLQFKSVSCWLLGFCFNNILPKVDLYYMCAVPLSVCRDGESAGVL